MLKKILLLVPLYSLLSLALLFLCLWTSVPASAQNFWQQTNGPYGGYVSSFAVSGTNLFAGTSGGIFLSTNNGTSWTAASTGLTNTDVHALAVSDTNLFAGTSGGGVFLSTNNGTSWTAASTGLTSTVVNALAVSGTNLFAGTSGGGVFLSTNNGTSWSAVNTGLTNTYVYALAVSGTNLFAGTSDGVFLSTNNGASWTAASTGLTNTYVNALAISGTNLFAGTSDGVFLSTNNGTSWTVASTGLTNTDVRALAFSGTNLFAGTNGGGVFLSTNNGASWTAASTGLTNTDVRALAFSGTNLFAGTYVGGVFLSTNNGTSWTAASNGLTNTSVNALAVSGTNLFAGTNGVFLSTNNGTSWSAASTGLTNTYVNALAISSTNLFAGTDGGVFLSTNNGTSWSAASTGLTSTVVNALAVSGTNLFAGTDGGIFLSTNNGTSWTAVNSGLPMNTRVWALAVSGANLFAGTNGGGIFLSTNNGTNWTAVNTGLTNTYVRALAVSPAPGGAGATNLFVGTDGGVFLSTNNGTSWTAVNTGLTNTYVRALAVSGTNLFAGTSGGGIFLSTNNGTSWTAANTGLTNAYVRSLAISPSGYVFAGTDGSGVFRSVQPIMQAQPPTVTSFTPTSGPIGTTVTITGTNFSSTAANNIVYFGAVRVPQSGMTSATSTSLSVTVPTGATYHPITVTVNGLTGYSRLPFIVTYAGGGTITNSSFSTKVDFTTGSGTNPRSVAIGDVDGDGKPDLAVANYGSNTVSVFRNTGTSGSVSFAAKVDFPTGLTPWSVAIGDVDGDGKPDLAVANDGSNTVSVFRNTGTSGSVSFAAEVDFPTGSGPLSVAIGDVDGDGKPDLAVANWSSNTVSVFRNTGTSGSVSFAAKVDFPTGGYTRSVAIGDVDGDGKPDLAVAADGSNTVSVFRNTGTSGSLSFAAKVDFPTGSSPLSVAIGDVDGDGKPDLAVANYYSSTVSVFRNTGTSGSVSFAAKVDFTTGSGPYSVAIGDVDGDGKPDLALANEVSNTVSVFRNTGTSGSVSFAAKVDFTTGTSPYSVAIGDVNGDGKPDLAVANWGSNTVSVFRNTIAASTTPPTPTLISPANGSTNQLTTLTLTWNRSGNTDTYRVQVATDTNFSNLFANDSTVTDTLKTISDLANLTIYYWRVNAKNSVGVSAFSSVFRFTTKALPAAPQNLAVTDSSVSRQIKLKWRKNSETDFLRYRIYGGTSPSPTTKLDSTAGGNISDTTKTITGLTNGIRYYFRVTAIDNSLNESGYSNEINATPADRPPAPPKNLVVLDSSVSKTIVLKWKKNDEIDFLRYRIYRSTTSPASTQVDSTTAGNLNDTTRVITGLANGTTYYFRITAVDSAGNESQFSNEVSVATKLPATSLFATAIDTDRVTLSWNSLSGAVRFRLYRGADSTNLTLIKFDTMSTFIDSTLTPSSKYFYRIAGVGSNSIIGDSSFAISVVANPATPNGLSFSTVADFHATLIWSSGGGTPALYKIYRSINGTTYSAVGTSVTSSFKDTTLAQLSTYYYKVSALNSVNVESPQSQPLQITTKRQLPRVTSVVLSKGNVTYKGVVPIVFTVTVAPGDTTGMFCYFSVDSGKTYQQAANISGKINALTSSLTDTIFWNTSMSLANKEEGGVQVRIVPVGLGGRGDSLITSLFKVDNLAPRFNGLDSVKSASSYKVGSSFLYWRAARDTSKPITYFVYRSQQPFNFSQTYVPIDSTQSTVDTLRDQQPNTDYYYFVRAKDTLGNIDTNRIFKTLKSALIADYDANGKIEGSDLSTFRTGWVNNNLNLADIGPTLGDPPNLIPQYDKQINFEDYFTFARMWNWSIKNTNTNVFAKTQSTEETGVDSITSFVEEPVLKPNESKFFAMRIDHPKEVYTVVMNINYNPGRISIDSLVLNFPEPKFTLKYQDAEKGSISFAVASLEKSFSEKLFNGDAIRILYNAKTKLVDEPINIETQIFDGQGNLLSKGMKKIEFNWRTKIPIEFALSQNYPNPFNPSTTIEYQLPKQSRVNLFVYNILGQEVIRLVNNQETQAGYYEVKWNGRNNLNQQVGSGVYFFRLFSKDFVQTKKMLLLK